MKSRFFDTDSHSPKSTRSVQVREEIIGKKGVQIENCLTVDVYLFHRIDHELNGVFMVQNHLGFESPLALCFVAEVDEALGVE